MAPRGSRGSASRHLTQALKGIQMLRGKAHRLGSQPSLAGVVRDSGVQVKHIEGQTHPVRVLVNNIILYILAQFWGPIAFRCIHCFPLDLTETSSHGMIYNSRIKKVSVRFSSDCQVFWAVVFFPVANLFDLCFYPIISPRSNKYNV